MSSGLPQHLTLDYLRALLSRGVEKTTGLLWKAARKGMGKKKIP